MSMTAAHFFKRFCEEVTVDGCYRPYRGRDGFTRTVVDPAMKRILTEDGNDYASEYYTVDHTAWHNGMTEEKKSRARRDYGLNPHFWSLTALVEHENDPRDFHYEVLKLAPFRCPLRVVIGYNARRTRFGTSSRSDMAKLSYLAELLQATTLYPPDTARGEAFLVILGDDAPGVARYRGYLYEGGAFRLAFPA